MQSQDSSRRRAMIVRAMVALALAVAALAAVVDTADARPWRRGPGYYGGWGPGWGPGWAYPGWGYPYWGIPPGGYSGPSNVWYVPPLAPEPAVVLPRKRCVGGRAPARWIKTRKDGREVWQHVMSRCR